MKPTARSAILDLLSTLRGGSMPVRGLVAAGAILELRENSMRVALARLLAAGHLERDERGQYRIGAAARAIHDRVAAWRRSERRVRAWGGGWIGVHTAGLGRSDRRALRLRGRALRFLGFRELAPGLELRPDNLTGGIAEVRAQLLALGLDRQAPVFALDDLDARADARARRLWDARALARGHREARALARGHREARAALERSARRLPALETEEAMRESFLVGGGVLRQIVLDPLLPDAIAPGRERRALVEAMRRYDRIGRAAWRDFMRGFGALPDRHGPVNAGSVASALSATAVGGPA